MEAISKGNSDSISIRLGLVIMLEVPYLLLTRWLHFPGEAGPCRCYYNKRLSSKGSTSSKNWNTEEQYIVSTTWIGDASMKWWCKIQNIGIWVIHIMDILSYFFEKQNLFLGCHSSSSSSSSWWYSSSSRSSSSNSSSDTLSASGCPIDEY